MGEVGIPLEKFQKQKLAPGKNGICEISKLRE